jgi:hypothetical protein
VRVLAKAYGDRPLDRVTVGSAEKVIYIATQSVADAMESGERGGVGFPRNCIFTFDSTLYDSLNTAWQAGDHDRLVGLWQSATPAVLDVKEAA